MTGDVPAADNHHDLPRHRLWMLVTDGQSVEACVCEGQVGLDLRIYYNGIFLRGEVSDDGRDIGARAQLAKHDWLAGGWNDR